jgi:hypothetical protein
MNFFEGFDDVGPKFGYNIHIELFKFGYEGLHFIFYFRSDLKDISELL